MRRAELKIKPIPVDPFLLFSALSDSDQQNYILLCVYLICAWPERFFNFVFAAGNQQQYFFTVPAFRRQLV